MITTMWRILWIPTNRAAACVVGAANAGEAAMPHASAAAIAASRFIPMNLAQRRD
jgi:hypothetical protein